MTRGLREQHLMVISTTVAAPLPLGGSARNAPIAPRTNWVSMFVRIATLPCVTAYAFCLRLVCAGSS